MTNIFFICAVYSVCLKLMSPSLPIFTLILLLSEILIIILNFILLAGIHAMAGTAGQIVSKSLLTHNFKFMGKC